MRGRSTLASALLAPRGGDAGRSGFRHYAAIDGLRAVAVLSIVVYHTGFYTNGLFGVDVFFVLSGVFVTLMLTREYFRGEVRVGRFYARRVKRLLPGLVVTLAITAVLVWMLGSPAERADFLPHALASLANIANWEQILNGDAYWEAVAPGPLSHMWSLSVTEQFYLIWPPILLLILFVHRRGRPLTVATRPTRVAIAAWVSTGLFLQLSIWTAYVFSTSGADRAYLGTDTHALSLAAGVTTGLIIAVRERRPFARTERGRRVLVRSIVGVVAAFLIVQLSIAAETYHASWLYYGGLAAVAVLAGVLVWSLTGPSVLTAFLSWTVLVTLGRASYSIFLVHLPLIWLVSTLSPGTPPLGLLTSVLPLSVLCGLALHFAVAEPLRRSRWRKPGSLLAATAVTLCATLIAVAGTPPAQTTAGGGVRVLTLGDSLGADFASALALEEAGVRTSIVDRSVGGCGIFSPEQTRTPEEPELAVPRDCLPWEQRYRDALAEAHPDVVLITLGWDAVGQKLDGKWTDLAQPAARSHYRAQLETLRTIVAAAGVPVLLTNSRPDSPVTEPDAAAAHDALIAEFVAATPEVTLLDLKGKVCPNGRCTTSTAAGDPLYVDGVHFSDAGLRDIAPWLGSAVAYADRR
ncbi:MULTISPECIES: acyltransferase family protein [Microbacteriaceae]|uniref:acyltransferase family protein n=1 Tax=Microbacteriaceae TaxID=85023 RepID=UPI0003697972|nr:MULTISPECIES: acyltransferase family protein [Microbacteriaceae]TDQ03857.1 peptidoglycan/LPS O-acetylase OafA/YrhL [Leifsonia sp. 115AMFTsu3.1]